MEISAIITTHKRPKLLQRAINSVVTQTYKPKEIIVVSDGRDPETDIVMDQVMSAHAQVRYMVVDPPQGANIARNKGIESADNEWIAFLDDDDEWLPEKLSKQQDAASQAPDVGLVCTRVRNIYEKEKISYVYKNPYSGDLSRKILIRNYVGATSTVLARRSLVVECGLFDPHMPAMQDCDLWIRLCQKTKVSAVPDVCVNCYSHYGDHQISQDANRYVEAFDLIEKKYASYYSALSDAERNEYEYNKNKTLSVKGLRNGNRRAAREWAVKALRNKKTLKAAAYCILSFLPFRIALSLRRIAG